MMPLRRSLTRNICAEPPGVLAVVPVAKKEEPPALPRRSLVGKTMDAVLPHINNSAFNQLPTHRSYTGEIVITYLTEKDSANSLARTPTPAPAHTESFRQSSAAQSSPSSPASTAKGRSRSCSRHQKLWRILEILFRMEDSRLNGCSRITLRLMLMTNFRCFEGLDR